jgi:NodT family efflux transporter outer membrane factor (OMF) lipoprotein
MKPIINMNTKEKAPIAGFASRQAQQQAKTRRWWGTAVLAGLVLLLNSCSAGSKYTRPVAEAPPAYKEQPPVTAEELGSWKTAQPGDDASRGKWWMIYSDPHLNALEEQINISNQTLKAAEAQFRQARALVHLNRAGNYPTITTSPSISASRPSANRSSTGTSKISGDFLLPFTIAYEPDLWGRVRIAVEGSVASAQASAADIESTRLLFQAELAADYFQLRTLDMEKQLLESSVKDYEKALELTTNRFKGGVASRLDVSQAETQLETTQAQAVDVGVERAQLEHAMALLTGQPASTFSIAPASQKIEPLPVPPGLPSTLLERRPDIAAAERRVAAANAQVGLAKTAYYPLLNLVGSVGLESSHISSWFSWPSRLWSVGPSLAQTLFDGGKRRAQTEQFQAAYDATVASYREGVLSAFQEVEDNLAALRILAEEARIQDTAVKSSDQSVVLSINQYKGGVATYLQVIIAQSAALGNKRTALNILQRQMTANILLIKALGGGWDSARLPPASELEFTKSGSEKKGTFTPEVKKN